MANSDHLFLLKQNINKHQIQFNLLPIPNFKFHDAAALLPRHQISNPDHEIQNPNEISQKQEYSRRQFSLGELTATEDNNGEEDGFKTPDRKIPELKQCPPAPRKPCRRKRKGSEGNARRSLRFDLSEEFESLFPRVILADFNRKIKKSRTDN